jgi:putative OmpL-like beta-barrel porin-2/carboxypeptidase family protein
MNLSLKSSTLAGAARAAGCIVAIGVLVLASSVALADSDGTIVGIITDSAKLPVAHATVTATKVGGGGIRATVSGSDGVYSFADLPAGAWSVTSQVDGSADVTAPQLEVVAGNATRYDIVMNAQAAPAGPATASSAAPPARAIPVLAHPGDSILNGILALVTPSPAKPIVVAQSAAPAPAAAAAPAPTVPEALQAPEPAPENDTVTPLANAGDITWMLANGREHAPVFDTKFFTPEIRFDMNYLQSFNHPQDHTIVGSTEEFRSGEFQIEQVSFGGNFHWNNVQARFLSMFGLFATTTPRNDASDGVGQWNLKDAYKYMSEANAGYHWDNIGHGLNVDVGIFVSYIGLFSYYNFDNWTYQPSFVSSNTPWFFNGLRIQYWPTQNLKIEPWLINGWQSYAKYNGSLGFGGQILWIPNENFKMVFNSYTLGEDNLNSGSVGAGQNANLLSPQYGYYAQDIGSANPNASAINYSKVHRIHEDDSLLYKYYDSHGQSGTGVSKMAFTLTWDVGCEYGGGVTCFNGPNKANFVGVMGYDRTWFNHDLYAVTLGGGFFNNPGRYLALTPPIAGATAQTGTPYFTQNPGQKLYQWDTQLNFQYMPKEWITWWTEATFRHSDVPYWSGQGGVTPPGPGGVGTSNLNGPGGSYCNNGSTSAGLGTCGAAGGDWFPDLTKREVIWGAGVMVKF